MVNLYFYLQIYDTGQCGAMLIRWGAKEKASSSGIQRKPGSESELNTTAEVGSLSQHTWEQAENVGSGYIETKAI